MLEPILRSAAVCADIGGSFIKAVVFSGDGTPGPERRVPTPAGDWDAFCAALAGLCEAVDPSAPLSLSIAGVVDPDGGHATVANIPCINGRRLGPELGDALARPVVVANDADCFALAEALSGAGIGHRVVFGVILGTGVGGGLVVDGRIVEGAGGVAGEWGHGPVVRAMAVGDRVVPPFACGCGQVGCLDTAGSARGLERLDAHLHGRGRDSVAIVEAWRGGEDAARRTVELWLDVVSGPLSLVVNVTGASLLPVGGGLSNSAALVAALDGALRARILRRTPQPILVPAILGPEAGLIGAALNARRIMLA